jgi:hypothetical protein
MYEIGRILYVPVLHTAISSVLLASSLHSFEYIMNIQDDSASFTYALMNTASWISYAILIAMSRKELSDNNYNNVALIQDKTSDVEKTPVIRRKRICIYNVAIHIIVLALFSLANFMNIATNKALYSNNDIVTKFIGWNLYITLLSFI